MNLENKRVEHKTFGKGNVVNYNDSYIKINFESGIKEFVFPDVFDKYIKLIDQRAADLVSVKIQEKKEKLKKEELELRKEVDLKREERRIINQVKDMKNRKIDPEIQSVFWVKEEEEEKVFSEWKVFTGRIKSGEKKGQPRKLVRINQNSACLITRRDSDMAEEARQILGVFMVDEYFQGQLSDDGYIPAHTKYRIHLSEQESQNMLFWNYHLNKKFPDKMTWNSGKQRYFDNIWMAQILKDIVSLREGSQNQEEAQQFFSYFCRMNRIDNEKLPIANGALKNNQTSDISK